MDIRNLICIGCPMGCPLVVKLDALKTGEVNIEVTGNTCRRGEVYGKKEVTNPTRIVTTTVRVEGGTSAMVSVKTASDIPKEKIFSCMAALKGMTVKAPVCIGDVILPDVVSTGVDIVATGNVDKA